MTFLGKIMPACNKATFEAQFIKKLSKTVAELKNAFFIQQACMSKVNYQT